MGSSVEPAARSPIAILPARLTLWTTMTVNTVWIVTIESIVTRGGPGYGLQNNAFALGQLVRMIVIAVGIGAFAKEEVEIAELHLLYATHLFTWNVLKVEAVHALPVLVAFDGFLLGLVVRSDDLKVIPIIQRERRQSPGIAGCRCCVGRCPCQRRHVVHRR